MKCSYSFILVSHEPESGPGEAIESSMTILLDDEEVIKLADKLGIAIVALNAEELQLRAAS